MSCVTSLFSVLLCSAGVTFGHTVATTVARLPRARPSVLSSSGDAADGWAASVRRHGPLPRRLGH